MVFEDTAKQGINSFLLNAEASRNHGGTGVGTVRVGPGQGFKTHLLTPMPLVLQHKLEENSNCCGFVEPEFQLVKLRTSFTDRRMPVQRDECNIKIPSRWGLEFPKEWHCQLAPQGLQGWHKLLQPEGNTGRLLVSQGRETWWRLEHHCPELLCAFFNTREVPNCQSYFYISAFYFN